VKLVIRPLAQCEREDLRTLLMDAADQLAGDNCRLLEAELPWEGRPILLADARGCPVLVSFDPGDARAALINGLLAADRLAVELPWMHQTYSGLDRQQRRAALVVVSTEPPPGGASVLAAVPELQLFGYRLLRVNDDTGILLEAVTASLEPTASSVRPDSPQPADHSAAVVHPIRSREELPPLSEQELAYFQQL
jgi:hypothetical protein